jgi:hypothetical protein
MPWFWGGSQKAKEEGSSSEEYSSGEEEEEEEEESYSSGYEDDDADSEKSPSDNEEEQEENSGDGGGSRRSSRSSEEEEEGEEDDDQEDASSSASETGSHGASTPLTKSSAAESLSEEGRFSNTPSSTEDNSQPISPPHAMNGFKRDHYASEFDDDDVDDDDDDKENESSSSGEQELERIEAGVPEHVVGALRARAPSILSMGGTDDLAEAEEEESNASTTGGDTDESIHSDGSQENEHVTTLAEKQSLLVLAAEHDRVDILNSVMSNAQDEETKNQLLHGGAPPLHIAVLNGSTNSATCLLRLGADPSIRPNVKEIAENQDPQAPLQVPKQIDNLSAWEIAFVKKLTPKAKQQGILHAFSAEALRCMGSDEGNRLQQLLDAGMPSDTSMMGDKSLYDWAVDLGAPNCQKVLRPVPVESANLPDDTHQAPVSQGKSAVLDRPGSGEMANQLFRQLEELESLAKALSTCLDNLAEEVSVSHGLLLMGGGGSALAAHVRSLKTTKEQKYDELSRFQDALEHAHDELEYWIKKAGSTGDSIAAEETPVSLNVAARNQSPPPKFADADQEREYCEDLRRRIEATNDKIRKFRVSIADLSEENDRNIQEVEKRGLTGGINLVRGLKDEIREIEFALDEARLAEAVYKAKINKIQAFLNEMGAKDENHDTVANSASGRAKPNGHTSNGSPSANLESMSDAVSTDAAGGEKPSDRITSGKSTAIVLRPKGPAPGLFPLSLWQILLRIMGLRDTRSAQPVSRQSSSGYSSQPAMIV